MKKIMTVIAVTAIIATGCSKTETVQTATSQPTQVTQQTAAPTATPEPKKEVKDPKIVVKDFYDNLLKKNYDKLTPYIYPNNLGMSVEEYIKQTKEYDFKNSLERKEYLIGDIKDYDATHKMVKVIMKNSTPKNSAFSSEDLVGLVLVNGDWKLDYSLIIEKTPINKEYASENKSYTIIAKEKIKKLNGYTILLEVKNNMSDKKISFGWAGNQATSILKTNKGEITAPIDKFQIEPNASNGLNINFVTEATETQSVKVSGLMLLGSNNLPLDSKPFMFEIPLN